MKFCANFHEIIILPMSRRQSIFVTLLELLKVKHTKAFSNQYFSEHPHKNNLFGLSKMLSEYNVKNVATRIANKELDVSEIQPPFIAYFGRDFVVVQKVTSNEVSFLWKGLTHVLPVAKFTEAWSGVVLLVEPSEESIEPDYKEHQKTELLNFFKKGLLTAASIFILLLTYLNRSLFTELGISLLLLINLTGFLLAGC